MSTPRAEDRERLKKDGYRFLRHASNRGDMRGAGFSLSYSHPVEIWVKDEETQYLAGEGLSIGAWFACYEFCRARTKDVNLNASAVFNEKAVIAVTGSKPVEDLSGMPEVVELARYLLEARRASVVKWFMLPSGLKAAMEETALGVIIVRLILQSSEVFIASILGH